MSLRLRNATRPDALHPTRPVPGSPSCPRRPHQSWILGFTCVRVQPWRAARPLLHTRTNPSAVPTPALPPSPELIYQPFAEGTPEAGTVAPTFLPGRGVEQVNCTTSPADTPRLSLLSVALRANEDRQAPESSLGDGSVGAVMAARRDAGPRSKDVMDDKDPRLVRSRNRLVDAASALLKTGGVDAVTVGAVSRMSWVARTTFYRHSTAAPICWLRRSNDCCPHADVPDARGPIRDSLVRLVRAQAALIEQAPLQLTTLAWLAMVPEEPGEQQNTLAPLRARVIAQYREPFDQVLQSAAAQKELDEFDPGVAITQLVGPLVFARLSGLRSMSGADCEQLVDDSLAAHRRD